MSNQNQEVSASTNNIAGVLVGLVMGTLAGAAAMLLLAPQSGEKTRQQIQEKSIELRDQTTELIGSVVDQVRADGIKLSQDGRQKARELFTQGQSLVVEQLDHVSNAVNAGKKAIQNTEPDTSPTTNPA